MRIPKIYYMIALAIGLTCLALMPDARPASAQTGPTTWTVMVGGEVGNEPTGQGATASWQLLRFLPNNITINKGDSIIFKWASHDLHNALIAKAGSPPPQFNPAPPTFQIPTEIVLPSGGNTYNGSAVVNSGLFSVPGVPLENKVTFTATGTFDFMCSIHGAYDPATKTFQGMVGKITVQEAGSAYPKTPAQVDAEAKASLDAALTATKPVDAASTKVATRPGPNGTTIYTVPVGAVNQNGPPDGERMRYGALNLNIHVGDTVEWPIMSLHTVTFTSGAPYPSLFKAVPQPNGPPNFFLDPAALAPIGGKTYNGTGIASSGASLAPPDPNSPPPGPYTLTFTKAGSYEYACLFHMESGMFAHITVTEAPTLPLPNTGVTLPSLYFPITGYGLGGAFLSYWKNNGSLEIFGYPIDSERQSDGKIFQWLERNRLELHPENTGPYNILLGRLGAEELEKKGIDWTTLPKVSSAPEGCRYFAETGHSVCGDFLNYWQSHGLNFDGPGAKTYAESLALFGLPLSEPRMETNSSGDTVITQWFERARFEYHPDNPSQYRVLLGRLGAEMYALNASQN